MTTMSTRLLIVAGVALFIAGVAVGGVLATGDNPTPPTAAVLLSVVAAAFVGSLWWLITRLYRHR